MTTQTDLERAIEKVQELSDGIDEEGLDREGLHFHLNEVLRAARETQRLKELYRIEYSTHMNEMADADKETQSLRDKLEKARNMLLCCQAAIGDKNSPIELRIEQALREIGE
jgi:hypothetical protein